MGSRIVGNAVGSVEHGCGKACTNDGFGKAHELTFEIGFAERVFVMAWRVGDFERERAAVVELDRHAIGDSRRVARGQLGVFDDFRPGDQFEQGWVV